jgi:hypothetical protein
MPEYGNDVEEIDAKLGNKMLVHVPRLNTILLFMIWNLNLMASFKYESTCENAMSGSFLETNRIYISEHYIL